METKTEKLWENKYVAKIFQNKTLRETIYTYMDKFGAVLYLKNSFGGIQRIYSNEEEYIRAIEVEDD